MPGTSRPAPTWRWATPWRRGKPSAYVVVPGPGFLNTTAALSTAYAVNAPVLALTGQIQQAMIGRNVGLLHELPDQLAIMRGLTKWADRITAPAAAPGLVNEAFRRLLSGRRRPVALECAMDTWARKAPVELHSDGRARPTPARSTRTRSSAPPSFWAARSAR